jgi:hypothetical protein
MTSCRICLVVLALLCGVLSAAVTAQRPDRVALGAAISVANPRESGLETAVGAGPVLRLPPREGWGPSFGFSWLRLEDEVNEYRIRPIMAGVSYSLNRDRVWISPSLVAGIALNSVKDREDDDTLFELDNSFAWRPGVSVWYDLTDRVGLNTFLGYVVTRPDLRLEGLPDSSTIEFEADSLVWTAGFAVWVF